MWFNAISPLITVPLHHSHTLDDLNLKLGQRLVVVNQISNCITLIQFVERKCFLSGWWTWSLTSDEAQSAHKRFCSMFKAHCLPRFQMSWVHVERALAYHPCPKHWMLLCFRFVGLRRLFRRSFHAVALSTFAQQGRLLARLPSQVTQQRRQSDVIHCSSIRKMRAKDAPKWREINATHQPKNTRYKRPTAPDGFMRFWSSMIISRLQLFIVFILFAILWFARNVLLRFFFGLFWICSPFRVLFPFWFCTNSRPFHWASAANEGDPKRESSVRER